MLDYRHGYTWKFYRYHPTGFLSSPNLTSEHRQALGTGEPGCELGGRVYNSVVSCWGVILRGKRRSRLGWEIDNNNMNMNTEEMKRDDGANWTWQRRIFHSFYRSTSTPWECTYIPPFHRAWSKGERERSWSSDAWCRWWPNLDYLIG